MNTQKIPPYQRSRLILAALIQDIYLLRLFIYHYPQELCVRNKYGETPLQEYERCIGGKENAAILVSILLSDPAILAKRECS
jgi:hypothetical protein